jgi:hypothetical protein
MLRTRRLLLVVVAAGFILSSPPIWSQCGVERWSVKTGTDPDASMINLNSTTSTTIASMRAFTAPNPIPPNNRVSPAETTIWAINATLTLYKLESDSDYHLVIQDASGNTMITEIPMPSCVGSSSPLLPGITNARSEFDAKLTATTSFQTANIPVQIVGVGMFDFLHGQTGVAPNGIEIHPILDIIFNPGTPTPDFSLSASPAGLSVAQGGSGSTTISTSVSGGFSSAVSLSLSGLPSGVTASFTPTAIAAPGNGSSTLTFSASSTAPTGSSTVTVTASGGGVTHTTTVALTVTPTATPDFTLSNSPGSLSVAQGSSGSSTISTTVSGGFNSAISLSASSLPSGVTVTFNPASIAAPGGGSSTLTFSASSTATTGTTNISVMAIGGGITHTATLALTITAAGGGGTTQLLGNPGFENGASNPSPWTVSTTAATNRIINSGSTEPPHSGIFDAWLDGHGSTTTDSILQLVTIPANATAATLTFWLHIDTAETTTTTAYDTLAVQVRNSSGSVLSTLAVFSNLNHAAGYQQKSFDLTSFKGQTVRIFLQGKEDSILQTSFVVDDFALNVMAPGGGTTAPTTFITSPANGATVSGTVTVTATASDSVGVTQMQILIDGSVVTSNTNSTSLSFSFGTTNVTNGPHTIVSRAFDAAGNVGTSPTVTVTVANGSTTTELIGNGGFENGSANPAPWVLTSSSSPVEIINNSSSEPAHTGSWDAWLDGFGSSHTDTVMQQVSVPSNATAATLSFWLHIDTAETTATTAYDKLTVQVRDSAGSVLSTLATYSNLNHVSGYQQHTFDLSAFKGQTIQIFFQGVEDFELQTSFVIDDVSLQVTQ